MAELPQLILPYQVPSPARGNFADLTSFIMQRFMTDQAMQKAEVDERTRQSINQQQGYGDIDPFGLQKFNTQENANTINMGDYGMRKTNFDQTQDFVRNFMGAAQNNPTFQNDPVAAAFIAGGANPMAAQGLVQQLGIQGQNNAELEREKIRTQGDLERTNLTNQAKLQGMRDEYGLKADLDKQGRSSITESIRKFMETGDKAEAIANGLNTDMLMMLGEDRVTQMSEKKAAEEQARLAEEARKSRERLSGGLNTENGKPQLSPEQQGEISKAQIDRFFSSLQPADRMHGLARMAAGDATADPRGDFDLSVSKEDQEWARRLGEQAFGSDFVQLYQQVLEAHMRQLQQRAYQEQLSASRGGNIDFPAFPTY